MKDVLNTNKEFIDDFLNTIEKEFKIHCIQRRYRSGYFMFDYGKDSVCIFMIKEIPEFTFGLWMSSNVNLEYYDLKFEDSKLILFTQPTINMDKFKPSRCTFCEPVNRYLESDENNNQFYTWDMLYVEQMINYLRKHKIRAFYKDGVYIWDMYDDISNFKALKFYIKCYYNHYKEIIFRYLKNRKLTRLVKKKFGKLNNVKVELVCNDRNWSPQLDAFYYITDDISEEENNKLTEVDEWFDKHYFMDISLREVTKETFEKKHEYYSKSRSTNILWMKD